MSRKTEAGSREEGQGKGTLGPPEGPLSLGFICPPHESHWLLARPEKVGHLRLRALAYLVSPWVLGLPLLYVQDHRPSLPTHLGGDALGHSPMKLQEKKRAVVRPLPRPTLGSMQGEGACRAGCELCGST